jgi:hypothetical protein
VHHGLEDETRRRISRVMAIVAPAIAAIIGLAMLGFSIWGFWLCGSIFPSTGEHAFLSSALGWRLLGMCLSWLLLFGPLACFGSFILWSTFKQLLGREDRSWIYPVRMFMVIIGMRVAAEARAEGKTVRLSERKLLEGETSPKD